MRRLSRFVNGLFLSSFNNEIQTMYASAQMAGSRTKRALLLGFGGVLKELHTNFERERGRSFSHEALARVLTARGPHLSIDGGTLWRWEKGEVHSPDPLILRELAAIYNVDFAALLAVLEANRADSLLSVEGARTLLESTLAETANPFTRPSPPETTEDVVALTARLIDTAESLNELAESLLRRHVAALGDLLPARHAGDSARSGKTPR